MPARVTRRSFLVGAVAAAGACSTRSRAGGQRATIAIANHPVYIDSETNAGFTASTGIAVEYHEEITDDDAWLRSVTPELTRGRSIDRDVVIASDWVADRIARKGWLRAEVEWASGMAGIAFDPKRVDTPITRAAQLFRPALRGKVSLPLDMRMALGLALLTDGVDPATVTVEEARVTAGHLANSVRLGQVSLDAVPRDRLVAGTATAGVVRASDVVGTDLTFVVPEEGGMLFTDVALIPTAAAHLDGADAYLQYVSEPVHAAGRFRQLPAMWSDQRIGDVLRDDAPAVLADPRRNPPAATRARLHRFRLLEETDETAFRALMSSVARGGA
ncbi:MAG TPA: ABC transporter substrate-binding protein [Acidimicrobiales bacterium]|nr:ABC transporter substrate-binding protein [Acidimicrobiales bacterium]